MKTSPLLSFVTKYVTIVSVIFSISAAVDTARAEKSHSVQPPEGPHTIWPLQHRLGCTHTAGTYNFTDEDYLNEGAEVILDAGMRVFKGYLTKPDIYYRFNSDWPKRFDNLVEMADYKYYKELFRKPFSSFVLTTYSTIADGGERKFTQYSEENLQTVTREFYELSKYLLNEYRGTGKIFVLQNWEGDWALRNNFTLKPEGDPGPEAIEAMIKWTNARQAGVDKARKEVTDTDVKVYHALEVNRVDISLQDRPSVTNNVLPQTRCDLYSYSAYDSIGKAVDDPAKGRALFRKSLNYIAEKAPDSKAFGSKNIFIGEFGWPQIRTEKDPHVSPAKQMNVLRTVVDIAIPWGCPYVIYWEVFDNEALVKDKRPTTDEVRGFYLIGPDGEPGVAWHYFRTLLPETRSLNEDPGFSIPEDKETQ
jgi:hypothetical protein